jgi:hypothetical protein
VPFMGGMTAGLVICGVRPLDGPGDNGELSPSSGLTRCGTTGAVLCVVGGGMGTVGGGIGVGVVGGGVCTAGVGVGVIGGGACTVGVGVGVTGDGVGTVGGELCTVGGMYAGWDVAPLVWAPWPETAPDGLVPPRSG